MVNPGPNQHELENLVGKGKDEKEDELFSDMTQLRNGFDVLEVPETNCAPLNPVYTTDKYLKYFSRLAMTANTLCLVVGGIMLVMSIIN